MSAYRFVYSLLGYPYMMINMRANKPRQTINIKMIGSQQFCAISANEIQNVDLGLRFSDVDQFYLP